MKKVLFTLLSLFSFLLSAQHTISGTFSPAKDYTWLIAYRLKPGTQVYAADTAIKNGKFTLNFPENLPPGMYRLVYAVPQEEYNFDVIYNGKEDIELTFDAENGVSFNTSNENKLFTSYFFDINNCERDLINFYADSESDTNRFQQIVNTYRSTQASYEEKSKGLIANQFIRANRPYIPIKHESIQDYVAHRKKNQFKHVDFKNPVLQASDLLTDKVTHYVFTAIPLEQMSQQETEKAMQENTIDIDKQLVDLEPAFKLHIFYSLWTQSAASGFNELSDFVYETYLKALASQSNKQDIIDKIEVHNRLRKGAVAPEIVWKDGDALKTLSGLEAAENYVLVFWSSTCSHCLKELPALHKRLKTNSDLKVVAVGLEDDDVYWKRESAKLEAFEHAISLGKWTSEYAKLYAVQSTPSYFILDKDKRIIAKPESDKDVVEFLEKE